MSQNPDEIRAEIDRTRNDLSRNVDALGEAVQPGNVARRQVDKVTGKAADLKDKVMGTVPSAPSFGSSDGPGVTDRVSDAASNLGDQAQQAGVAAKQKAEGNPLAVGLIALGAGWLAGSLLPASNRERAAVREGLDRAQPMMEDAKSAVQEKAQEVAGNLQEPAQQAFAHVKETAQGAVENVRSEGMDQAQQVKESAQESAETVKSSAQQSAETVREDAEGSVEAVRNDG